MGIMSKDSDMYNKNILNTMNKEFLKMQKLAGLITENQFREKVTENEEFDVSQAYDKSPATQSYDDMLDVVSGFEDPDFDAVESFENSFTEGKEITKDAWEKWYRTNIDGGYDPDNYLEIGWISVTDPDIYDKAGV